MRKELEKVLENLKFQKYFDLIDCNFLNYSSSNFENKSPDLEPLKNASKLVGV